MAFIGGNSVTCEICSQGKKSRVIAGIPLCESCFNRITELRNHNTDAIQYFQSKKNFPRASKRSIDYIDSVLSNALEKQKLLEAEQQQKAEAEKRQQELYRQYKQIQRDFLITSGFNFEGYDIIAYLGLASGNTVIGTGLLSETSASISDLMGIENDSFSSKLDVGKNSSVEKIKRKAMMMGANALIGVDIDYVIFSSNMVGVIANGTAVKIQKHIQDSPQVDELL